MRTRGINWFVVAGLLALGLVGLAQGGASAAAQTTPSRTHLVVHPSPATTVQRVTLFASVRPVAGAPAPTGTVTFLDGSTSLGTATLTTSAKGRQVAEIAVHLTKGTHSLTASYGGDASTDPSTSAAVTLHVTAAPRTATTTTDTEIPGPTQHSATIRTLVKNDLQGYPDATGSVSFAVDGRPGQSVALDARRRAHLTVTLHPGTHHVTVTYPGDSTHQPSKGTLTFTTT